MQLFRCLVQYQVSPNSQDIPLKFNINIGGRDVSNNNTIMAEIKNYSLCMARKCCENCVCTSAPLCMFAMFAWCMHVYVHICMQ